MAGFDPTSMLAKAAMEKGASIGQMGMGATQMIQGAQQGKKANQMPLPMVDPNQQALLSEMNQRRKALMTGAGVQAGLNQVNQGIAGTQNVIARNTGGDAGGTIAGLLQSQRVGGQNLNQVLAGANQQQQYFTNLASDLNNRIAERRFAIQQWQKAQALAQAAELKKTGSTNFMTGLSSFGGQKKDQGQQQQPLQQQQFSGMIDPQQASVMPTDTTSMQSAPELTGLTQNAGSMAAWGGVV